jgi:hypothetical protein
MRSTVPGVSPSALRQASERVSGSGDFRAFSQELPEAARIKATIK